MKPYFSILCSLICVCFLQAQQRFTHCDSLKGGYSIARSAYDVQHYELHLRIDPQSKHIAGTQAIALQWKSKSPVFQVDLAQSLLLDSLVMRHQRLTFQRDCDAIRVIAPDYQLGQYDTLRVYYHGVPRVAKNAPWDGGMIWTQDAQGQPWVGVAVQGLGASQWMPVKDSQADEPDHGALLQFEVPKGLMAISNGRLLQTEALTDGFTRYRWQVTHPINAYDMTVYVGDYEGWDYPYTGVDVLCYALRTHRELAEKQWQQLTPMLDCFQDKFGPYPFAQDSFKMVEAPYLGMEHQSAVAYGNGFVNGYQGRDLSNTGIGLKFDFILVHESAHEWFGNAITSCDIADMWIHEGFTTYAESVFVECQYGAAMALAYENGQRENIEHDQPVIGPYGVGHEGSADMYPKGAALVQTLRAVLNNDTQWWAMMKGMVKEYAQHCATTDHLIGFMESYFKRPLRALCMGYLRQTGVPELQCEKRNGQWMYRWNSPEIGFDLPVDAMIDETVKRCYPTTQWQKIPLSEQDIKKMRWDTQRMYFKVKKKT